MFGLVVTITNTTALATLTLNINKQETSAKYERKMLPTNLCCERDREFESSFKMAFLVSLLNRWKSRTCLIAGTGVL